MRSVTRRTRRPLTVCLAAAALLLAACGGESTPGGGGTSGGGEVGAGTGADCDFDEELVTAAQEEGAVTIYAGGHTREGLDSVTESFQDAYGIPVTGVREESGAVVRMVEAELASGNLNADVVSLADAAAMADLAADGSLADSEPPNLDQLLDGSDDPESPQLPYAVTPLGIMYNEATLEDPPQSWEELTEFDGTIVVADPNASGTSLLFFTMLEEALGPQWLEDLSEADVVVTDSSLALAQLVLTGEADLAIPAIESAVVATAQGGEPLAVTFPQEVPTFSSELAAMSEAPNPNAARLFVSYHICQSYQETLTEVGGRTVLQDGPEPQGLQDLSGSELLTTDATEVEAGAADLRARFSDLFD